MAGARNLVDGLGCACGERDVRERGGTETGDVPWKLEAMEVHRWTLRGRARRSASARDAWGGRASACETDEGVKGVLT
jgi:hypothetical protein